MIRILYDWNTEPSAGPRRQGSPLTYREITVLSVDEDKNSFQAEDRTWLRWSRYGDPSLVMLPSTGERVRVGLDKSQFVRSVSLVPDSQPASQPRPAPPLAPATLQALAATRKPEPEPDWLTGKEGPGVVVVGGPSQDDRGVVITRLAVLNCATAILSSGGGAATLDEVLATAARLEAWALR